jgi:hypothetical protein
MLARPCLLIATLLLVVSLPHLSSAQTPAEEPIAYARGTGLAVGLKLGGGFGQPFGDLGTSFVGELEVGYVLPPLNRAIEIFLAGQYTAPSTEGTVESDARLPGTGVMSYELTQRQAILTLGVLGRIPIPVRLLRPYVAAGGRLYLMRTEVTGTGGGEPFGDNEETASQLGFFAALGGELFVGPGALLLEIGLGYAPVDGFVLRNTNVGSLSTSLGYRLFL